MADPNTPPPAMTGKKKVALFGTTAAMIAAVSGILGSVYKDEGGYVNHPKDPGGATNYGVTQAVARANGYTGAMQAFPKQCFETSDVCADKIYYQNYMEKPGYLPVIAASPPIGEELVNTAVNMGTLRATKFMQQALNDVCVSVNGKAIVVDGKMGPGTVSYFTTCQAKVPAVIFCTSMLNGMDGYQKSEYDRLVRNNNDLKVFYKGWINNRIGNVDRKKCLTTSALTGV